jgi:ABC-type transport system substrate-binding protein
LKRIIALILFAAMVCLFAGCTEENPDLNFTGRPTDPDGPTTPTDPVTGTQQISLAYDPEADLNPLTSTSYTNRVLFSLMYQSLFAVDNDYVCHPVLCKNYNVSKDMRTYTFYLEDALFSDGTHLTAEDVVASLQAAKTSSFYGKRLQYVDSFNAYGSAVVVELDVAMVDLPILLDIPIVKASQVAEAQPLGTGPYRMDTQQLKRVAGWWCSAKLPVNCDVIPLVNSRTTNIREAFERGQISLLCADPGDYHYVPCNGDYELWDSESGLFLYLVCNSKSKIFSNDTIRSALTYAIDRDYLSKKCYYGYASGATLPASPQFPHYNSNQAAKYDYDPQRFQQVLNESGLLEELAEGEKLKLTLLLNADDPLRLELGEAIAKMLEAQGFTVNIFKATASNYLNQLRWGSYDLYLAQTRLSANMDLSSFFSSRGSLNYGGLTNAVLQDLSLKSLANAGNYYSLHDKVMSDGQLCPLLFHSYAVYVRRGALTGLNPSRDAVFYYDLGRTMEDALMKD